MQKSSSKPSQRSFRLSNLHVVLILLVAGALLLSVIWVLAVDIGRAPVSLWDICMTPQTTSTDVKK